MVPAHKLHLLPTVSMTKSEVGLSVRMEKLEKAVQSLVDRPQQPGALGAALERGRSVSYSRVAGGRAATPVRSATPARAATPAWVATPVPEPELTAGGRAEVPDNGKRRRTEDEEGFRQQGRPRKERQDRPRQEEGEGFRRQGRPGQGALAGRQGQRKVAQGSSQVDLSDVLGVAVSAPLDFYVGNTSLEMSSEQVKQVLVRCAAGVQGNTAHLEVLEVKEIGTDLANRRTRCWKVTVPHALKELMKESSLYPSGWTHRRFFVPRPSNKRAGQPPAAAGTAGQVAVTAGQAAETGGQVAVASGAEGAETATATVSAAGVTLADAAVLEGQQLAAFL